MGFTFFCVLKCVDGRLFLCYCVCYPQHCEKLAYLARRMQAVEQERAELQAALNQLDAAAGVAAPTASTGNTNAATSKIADNFETPIYE